MTATMRSSKVFAEIGFATSSLIPASRPAVTLLRSVCPVIMITGMKAPGLSGAVRTYNDVWNTSPHFLQRLSAIIGLFDAQKASAPQDSNHNAPHMRIIVNDQQMKV
jgi:hypothetical protein